MLLHGAKRGRHALLQALRAAQHARRWGSSDAFGSPPALPQRRVVVTGLGLVTPLAVGVEASWSALIRGATGVRRLTAEDLPEEHRAVLDTLPSQASARLCRRCPASEPHP